MKIISDYRGGQFVLAPFKNQKIVSPICIQNGEITNCGITIGYDKLYYADQLRKQIGFQTKHYEPIQIYTDPKSTNYILDPLSYYINRLGKLPKTVSFDGFIEYHPIDNSSFWWEMSEPENGFFEYSPLIDSPHLQESRIYGVSLNPGFIVAINEPNQKILMFTFMGAEKNIIGRSINHNSTIRQFSLIQQLWPELDLSSSISNQSRYITYNFKPPTEMSLDARIIYAIKDTSDDVVLIGESHKPNLLLKELINNKSFI